VPTTAMPIVSVTSMASHSNEEPGRVLGVRGQQV
jgi:hypothetical protein